MAAFEDNNPFASPSSPASSRANPYAPFGGYPFAGGTNNPHASFDNTHRPTTSSSEDVPAYQYGATNSDFSAEPQQESAPEQPQPSREKDEESCCRIDEIFRRNPEMRIVITDAGKASDGGAHFIAYTIDVGVCQHGVRWLM